MPEIFPNLVSIEGSRLEPAHKTLLRRVRDQIRSRIPGAEVWIDRFRLQALFGYRTQSGYPRTLWDRPLFHGPNPYRYDPILGEQSVDDIVRLYALARTPAATKARWKKGHEAMRKHDQDEALRKAIEAAHPESLKRTEYEYDKHSIGRHYRRSVLMG